MKIHTITEAEYQSAKEAAKRNKHKRVEKRLQVIILRYEGKKDWEIGEKLGYTRQRVSQLCAEFKKVGVAEYAKHKYGGNHRAMSEDEEEAISEEVVDKATEPLENAVEEAVEEAVEDAVEKSAEEPTEEPVADPAEEPMEETE